MKPRLSGYLRLVLNEDHDKELDLPLATECDPGVSWNDISELCGAVFNGELFNLLDVAQEMAGKHTKSAQVEEYAAFLFRTFSNESTHQERVFQLKSVFGTVPEMLINQARKTVESICRGIKEYELEFSEKSSFEESVHFNEDAGTDNALSDIETSEDEMNGEMEDGEFPLKEWMETYFSKDDVQDLCTAVISCRRSSKNAHEFQSALFDLLGADKIELILVLIQNMDLLDEDSYKKKECEPRRIVRVVPGAPNKSTMPSYGTQVTIMSSTEKALHKEIRRLDKKKIKNGGADFDTMDFDVYQMKQERQYQLAQAASRPLLRDTNPVNRPRYPFVFDEYAESIATSAFLGGSKVALPESAERDQDSIRELVHLPARPRDSVPHIRNLIKIEELDEICQVGFKNTKSLNNIQSVVFDAAYKSSENLLICAPTGAGKTNIAMLTILREIRAHLQQGVIRKDDFKVVYVAPMKALAAEMVRNFGKRLNPLGINVRELTGDMNLTKSEIKRTQMLVTTPEKWDVVTRKSTGDVALIQLVTLLIIDEVHLLHDDRGAVLESLVARTLRQVEASQKLIRIVGLSATLPNYVDVARFLHVNPYSGLFFFDDRFRPVPLSQTFIGIKGYNISIRISNMNRVCYDEMIRFIKRGDQVMIFVHARNETLRTCKVMREMAKNLGHITLFRPEKGAKVGEALKEIGQSRHRELSELMAEGFAVHHAGMLRQDRNMVEKQFANGFIRVLVCTATLAWGVNLPARAVIIKGTDVYDAKHGCLVDLGILDVLQIFGRAGRPQFDTHGDGVILTANDKLSHYLSLVTRRNPIESQFMTSLKDNLNAEISLGTVTNIEEGVKWLSYTYLFVRMRLNPLVYGLKFDIIQKDPILQEHRTDIIVEGAKALEKAKMIRFDQKNGYLFATDMGRVASHFYINYETVETFNEKLAPVMSVSGILEMVALSREFNQIKVRDEEVTELQDHLSCCDYSVKGGVENPHGKVNVLLQSFISKFPVENFSLNSDMAYIAQNAGRIMRALFEIALKQKLPLVTAKFLDLSKAIDKRLWPTEHPLKQFPSISFEMQRKIDNMDLNIHQLRDMEAADIGRLLHHVRKGPEIKGLVNNLPMLELDVVIQPITRTVLRMQVNIVADFDWNDRVHGMTSENYWLWVEDADTNNMYHSESILISKAQVVKQETVNVTFTIPISEPFPNQYHVKVVSERWLGVEAIYPVSFKHLILPETHPPHTELLDLQPLPVTALQNPSIELLYKFTHFNPIQTQIFHTIYHTEQNVLLGAPTGSGKTVAAELAIFRLFREYPGKKAVYIAPLKALVRERMEDWKVRICSLGRKVIELTGDVTPDVRAIDNADLIVTTPEKWDGISRSWQNRSYVQAVQLIVIDEIHLLGADRGPVLEVIVSRTNYISSHTSHKVRVVGLSTALANAHDLSDWLGIKEVGLYNFRPSVRPVPLQAHITGFHGKHYCPRMATMNKPCFQSIRLHSPKKPSLIFVSSRRQTRMTAFDLISLLASDNEPKQWLHMEESDMMQICKDIHDTNLRLTLEFGIGIHHAGLSPSDRKTVESLFVNLKIQVLIATSTLAWGVNFPARLVIVKGTEYYDGKLNRYVDFPITDVLQMMGRAGRPQFDDEGIAVIMVHDIKKNFYKKFLYEPFPVESSLLGCLTDHLNAEVVAGTVTSKQDAIDYVTWTYLFRRLLVNPSFYHLEDVTHEHVNRYLSALVEKCSRDLVEAGCITDDDGVTLTPETLGRLASYYYLSHRTVRTFHDRIRANSSIPDLMLVLADAQEYDELPVRHNEDQQNLELSKRVPLATDDLSMDSAHTKTFLLLQAHLSRAELPCSDYFTDTKSVLDQAIRILQAMLDVAADSGWLLTAIRIIHLLQMIIQGHWLNDSDILTLPHLESYHVISLQKALMPKGKPLTLVNLVQITTRNAGRIMSVLKEDLRTGQCEEIQKTLLDLPLISMQISVSGWWEGLDKNTKRELKMDSKGRSSEGGWLDLHADQEYLILINVARVRRKSSAHAHTPRFPKPKDEGWFLVMGATGQNELVAMKRVGGVSRRSTIKLSFLTPEHEGRFVYNLYLLSDSYIGLDQQFQLYFNIIPASIEAQVNTEMAV